MKGKNPEKREAWDEHSSSDEADVDAGEGVNIADLVAEALNAAEDHEEINTSQDQEGDSIDQDSSDFDSDDSDSDDSIPGLSNVAGSGEDGDGAIDGEELDEEDPVVKAIASAQEKKQSDHPPDLKLDCIPSAICFHPTEDIIATCTYDGDVLLYSFSNEENTLLSTAQNKDEIVREVIYSGEGDKLLAALSNQDLIVYDLKEGLRVERNIEKATAAPVSSLYVIDENIFVTGDDDGYVMMWDKRNKRPAATLKIGEDAITSMISNNEKRTLVCSSAEGAIYALKIRGGKVQTESEVYDYEFNCLGLFKQETKLAVGNGKGDVYVFNWDEFGKHSDIYTGIGRKESINALIPITERIIITGGDDGYIRAVNFFPQKFLGVVGKLPYPVDKMDVCNDGHLIASIGADECVKFWNVSYFDGMQVSTEDKPKKVKGKAKPKQDDLNKSNLPSSSHQNASDFFKGLM